MWCLQSQVKIVLKVGGSGQQARWDRELNVRFHYLWVIGALHKCILSGMVGMQV